MGNREINTSSVFLTDLIAAAPLNKVWKHLVPNNDQQIDLEEMA